MRYRAFPIDVLEREDGRFLARFRDLPVEVIGDTRKAATADAMAAGRVFLRQAKKDGVPLHRLGGRLVPPPALLQVV